ncbi:MAG: SurA N-terminal domain-containing protein [Deltaproteobacteria bacterium]|jgi:peptidyl-prolyl cis-trans isomerase SurA|nr:SurA N-terminal domain-containing protein [Deltaproteobacteria bacterium]
MITSKFMTLSGNLFKKALIIPIIFAFLTITSSLLGLNQQALAATTTDRIVAQVNNEVITLSDLQARIKSLPPEMKSSLPPGATLEEAVLNYMIETELINQVARRMGIIVSENEVDSQIEGYKQANNFNDAQLQAALARNGQTIKDFRAYLKFEILKDIVLRENILRKIVIPDKEVEAFLRGEGPAGYSPNYLLGLGGTIQDTDKVRLIFFSSSPDKSNEVMNMAAQVRQEVVAGLPFSEAAKRYSQGPGAEQGGDSGLTVGELQTQLQQIARTLTPGEVSQPLDGGQVVLLMYIEPPAGSTPAETAGSSGEKTFTPQQYQQARRQLEQIKLREKYTSWLEELKSKATIKILL